MNPAAAAMSGIRIAVASGHGVGKSALVAWIILWFISTRANPQIVVTANTSAQLNTKTWRELSKWHKLAIHKDWFAWTATKFYMRDAPDTWFASAIPWSKERSEAFAGTHEKHVLIIFDEASSIEDIIWEVAEGAMTTVGAMWICFGNPTRNTGRFRECWRKFRHRWITRQVDSRTAKMANQKQIQEWIEDHGEDSDFARIRIKGEFPRQASNQFISLEIVERAAKRRPRPEDYAHAPIIIGVDVARYGDDQSVILVRQGVKILDIRKFRELDTVQFAYRVMESIDEWKPDAVFVDAIGIGAGVVDNLKHAGYSYIEVNGALNALDDRTHHNKRMEMWADMRKWLKEGDGSLYLGEAGTDGELIDDLTAPEYFYDQKDRMQLESKDDMRARGIPSPDTADALAMTFYMPVRKRETVEGAVDKLKRKMRMAAMAGGSWMSRFAPVTHKEKFACLPAIQPPSTRRSAAAIASTATGTRISSRSSRERVRLSVRSRRSSSVRSISTRSALTSTRQRA